MVVEDAPWPVVELVLDGQEVLRRVGAWVGAFGEVVTQQPIDVFVRAALPR